MERRTLKRVFNERRKGLLGRGVAEREPKLETLRSTQTQSPPDAKGKPIAKFPNFRNRTVNKNKDQLDGPLAKKARHSLYNDQVAGTPAEPLSTPITTISTSGANQGQIPRPNRRLGAFEDSQGRMPPGWECREDDQGRTYYVDHHTRRNT